MIFGDTRTLFKSWISASPHVPFLLFQAPLRSPCLNLTDLPDNGDLVFNEMDLVLFFGSDSVHHKQ